MTCRTWAPSLLAG